MERSTRFSQERRARAELAELQTKIENAKRVKDEWMKIVVVLTDTEERISRLKQNELLAGPSVEELSRELAIAEEHESEAALRSSIRKQAHTYIAKCHPSECPVCGQVLGANTRAVEADSPAPVVNASYCDELRKKISDINQLFQELETLQALLARTEAKAATIAHDAEVLTGAASRTPDALERFIQKLDDVVLSATNQLNDSQSEHERRDRRGRDLESEDRFHNYQERVGAIEEVLEKDISGPRGALAEYDRFLATTEEISRLALEAFDSAVVSVIPPLADV